MKKDMQIKIAKFAQILENLNNTLTLYMLN